MPSPETALQPFVRQRAVLLTTYRRDGTAVSTPVNIAVDGGRAFIRTYNRAGKAKRLRNNPNVEIAPSTMRGKPTGPSIKAQARLLSGDESKIAARAIARKHRILEGFSSRSATASRATRPSTTKSRQTSLTPNT